MNLLCIGLGSRGDVQPVALIARELLRNPIHSSSISRIHFVTHYEHKNDFLDELFYIESPKPHVLRESKRLSSASITSNKINDSTIVSVDIYSKLKFSFCYKSPAFLGSANKGATDIKNSGNVLEEWKSCYKIVYECLGLKVIRAKNLVGICNTFSFPVVLHLFARNLGNLFIISPSPSYCSRISDELKRSIPDIISKLKSKFSLPESYQEEQEPSSESGSYHNQSNPQQVQNEERALKRCKFAKEATDGYESVLMRHIQAYLWIFFTDHYDKYLSGISSLETLGLEEDVIIKEIEKALCLPWIDVCASKKSRIETFMGLPHYLLAHGNADDFKAVLPGHTNIQRIGFIMQDDRDVKKGLETHRSKQMLLAPVGIQSFKSLSCFLKETLLPYRDTLIINFGSMSKFIDWNVVLETLKAFDDLTCIILISKTCFENTHSKLNLSQWAVYEASSSSRIDSQQESDAKIGKVKLIIVGSVNFPQLLKIASCILEKDSGKETYRKLALLHHGGAGTTAAATKYLVPQLIYPLCFDQRYWATYVQNSGLGFSVKTLCVSNLHDAIRKILGQRKDSLKPVSCIPHKDETISNANKSSMQQRNDFNGLKILLEKVAQKLIFIHK